MRGWSGGRGVLAVQSSEKRAGAGWKGLVSGRGAMATSMLTAAVLVALMVVVVALAAMVQLEMVVAAVVVVTAAV